MNTSEEMKERWKTLPEELETMFLTLGSGDDCAHIRGIVGFLKDTETGRNVHGADERRYMLIPVWGDMLFRTLIPYDGKDENLWLRNRKGLNAVGRSMEICLHNTSPEAFTEHRAENEAGRSTPVNIAQRLNVYEAVLSLLEGKTSAFRTNVSLVLDRVKRNTIYILGRNGACRIPEYCGDGENGGGAFVPEEFLEHWTEPLTMLCDCSRSLQFETEAIRAMDGYLAMLLCMPYGENRGIRAGFIAYARTMLESLIRNVKERYGDWLEEGDPAFLDELREEYGDFLEDMDPVYARLREADAELDMERARMERMKRSAEYFGEDAACDELYSFPLDLDSGEIRKLIRDNPDLPVVVFAGPNARWDGETDTDWLFCGHVTCGITEILDSANEFTQEVIDGRQTLWDMIIDSLSPFYDRRKADDRELAEEADRIAASYDSCWKKVIAIYADNREAEE